MQDKSIENVRVLIVAFAAAASSGLALGAPQAQVQAPAVAASVPAVVDAPSSEAAATVAALTRLEGETVVLKAELKKLETQTQIAQRAAELNRLNGGGAPDDVRVRAVEGLGGKLFATLESRSAGEFEVKVGDTLPNGMRIVAIKPNAVVAQLRSGARVQLPMVVSWDASLPDTTTAGFPPLPRN
jgi:type IV pilus biogenesis protein PilP